MLRCDGKVAVNTKSFEVIWCFLLFLVMTAQRHWRYRKY